ncbi:MAG TPA: SMC family ATPase, partial [Dehalococcoidia bacterium]|nr:SMC family ATPase [Dehalococcoidia bacterium]
DREAGSLCPVCRTELGPEGKKRVRDGYEAEGKQLAAQFRANKAKREAAEARANALQVEIKRLEAEVAAGLAALHRQTAEVERDEREANEAAQRLPALEQELADVRTRLQAGRFATEARTRLEALRARIAEAAYDEQRHRQAQSDVRRLRGAEDELRELQLAEQAVQAAHEASQRASQDLREWRDAAEAAAAREREARAKLAEQADPAEPLRRTADAVAVLEDRERGLRLALGAAEQKLEDCERYRRTYDALQEQLAKAKLEQQIFDDLAVAFGRRGVQALIIDSVIPEIEDEANRLLTRMTNGRMSVALSTQRQARSGDAIETLDITISDELGSRSYELFSGGEAFRINLALRIALSKLLARRAGAPLPTLIVDEGFGTQDAAGRERLLEALNVVARDFECLIVITHIDELKDHFERQIRVEKTPAGSVVRVI